MIEVQEEVKGEKSRRRKAQLEDKTNPWVEDDDSAEEADFRPVPVKKTDDDENNKMDEDEDEDPLDAYMSSLKSTMGKNSGVAMEESKSKESKISHVVATRVVVDKKKGAERGELVEANQDELEWSSEEEGTDFAQLICTFFQNRQKLKSGEFFYQESNFCPKSEIVTKNPNFRQKSKFGPKIKTLTTNPIFLQKSKIFKKKRIFVRKSKFAPNIQKIVTTNSIFLQKCKFSKKKLSKNTNFNPKVHMA